MNLVKADFEPCLGTAFAVPFVDGDGIFTELKLLEINAIGRPHAGREEPFSLIFEGPREHSLEQGTYFLQHPILGDQYIFIVPIAERGDWRQYESIFN